MNIFEEAKALLHSRALAYVRTFNTESIDARMVLEDLAKFCRANQSTFNEDPRLHAVLEGRREVWLRIQKHLNLTPDELWEIYRKD
ncbi:MAG: hypothetical protein KDA17_00555 [Candidatus Saccharibacteria bacterium]|nr:hypothetical protein [Candidatus Saccharibacteria bacterium]